MNFHFFKQKQYISYLFISFFGLNILFVICAFFAIKYNLLFILSIIFILYGVVGVYITKKLYKMSAILHERYEKVNFLQEKRKEFAANVAHELKTPITSLIGFTETLLGNPELDFSTRNRFLLIIDKQAKQMEAIIQDLLVLSRMENDKGDIRSLFNEESVGILLNDVVEICEYQAKIKNITLNVSIERSINLMMHYNLLSQAMVNIVQNAIQYSHENSQIIIEASTKNNFVVIKVTDNGVGIAPEHLPFLFERFYRIDRSRSKESGGSGLGLAIVKHVVQIHGGEIQVESVLGKGTIFILHLPQ